MSIIKVEPTFNVNSHYELFDDTGYVPEQRHILQFQKHVGFKFDDTIALMSELPSGSFIAGGSFRQTVLRQKINNYDIFFESEAAFLNTIRRIQNAPEGAFLHGYTPKVSLIKFLESDMRVYSFTHPEKPAIQLIRTRWYSSSEQIIQHTDLVDSSFCMNYDMVVDYHSEAVYCAQNKQIKINRVDHRVGTGQRLRERLDNGWTYRSYNGYSSSERDDYLTRFARFQARNPGVDPRFRS